MGWVLHSFPSHSKKDKCVLFTQRILLWGVDPGMGEVLGGKGFKPRGRTQESWLPVLWSKH